MKGLVTANAYAKRTWGILKDRKGSISRSALIRLRGASIISLDSDDVNEVLSVLVKRGKLTLLKTKNGGELYGIGAKK